MDVFEFQKLEFFEKPSINFAPKLVTPSQSSAPTNSEGSRLTIRWAGCCDEDKERTIPVKKMDGVIDELVTHLLSIYSTL
jgi:hypothetical protein